MKYDEQYGFGVILGGYCIAVCIVIGVAAGIWQLLEVFR